MLAAGGFIALEVWVQASLMNCLLFGEPARCSASLACTLALVAVPGVAPFDGLHACARVVAGPQKLARADCAAFLSQVLMQGAHCRPETSRSLRRELEMSLLPVSPHGLHYAAPST
jgi:hypothetical protein